MPSRFLYFISFVLVFWEYQALIIFTLFHNSSWIYPLNSVISFCPLSSIYNDQKLGDVWSNAEAMLTYIHEHSWNWSSQQLSLTYSSLARVETSCQHSQGIMKFGLLEYVMILLCRHNCFWVHICKCPLVSRRHSSWLLSSTSFSILGLVFNNEHLTLQR